MSAVIGYTYNAAAHCVRCTGYRFNATAQGNSNADANNIRNDARDREGNPVRPLFSTDETAGGYCDSCGYAFGDADKVARLLSVEAWRGDEGGWTWNNWHARGMVPLAWCDLKPRELLRRLRDAGNVNVPPPGCAAVEDDGHNVCILWKGTREPVAAIEYGGVPA